MIESRRLSVYLSDRSGDGNGCYRILWRIYSVGNS